MIMGNDPRFGGSGTGDLYIKVPVLLLGSYSSYGLTFAGLCYYRPDKKQVVVHLTRTNT